VSAGADEVARVVESFLDGQEGFLRVIGRSDRAFDVLVPSYWKESVALSIAVGDRTLRAEAFYMRSPEENHDRVFRLLLQRNERAYLWKFAVNEAGDASLVAEVPLDAVDEDCLDRLFGTFVTLVDETYVPYMERGYAGALAEQVRAGGPGLDQPPPWAKEWEAPDERPSDQRGSSSTSQPAR
jgi:hypothetical protein